MKPTVAHCLGQVIRELRLESGLSQVVFAEKSGLYQTYLSRIENGKANPSLNSLAVVAETLGITVFDIFEMTKSRFENR